jgi:hypothetical protein
MSPKGSSGGHGHRKATEVAYVPRANAEALLAHYERFFGPVSPVLVHEEKSAEIHLDTYFYAPTSDRPFITAATIGMSALPIETSHICEGCKNHGPFPKNRHEILMYLDPNWDFDDLVSRYSLLMMNYVAREPHVGDRSFGWGLSYQFPEELVPEGSLLENGFVMRPLFELFWSTDPEEIDDFMNVQLPEAEEVCQLNWLVPITRAECYIKRTEGPASLHEFLMDNDYFVFDVDRQCFVEYENRAQRRAREKAQRNRAKRHPVLPLSKLTCEHCGAH